ncbi:endo-1,4-beta-xylanase [Plantactinospora siamensis]|uniref:Beta-xylanase n=1 Tax=Plantactinospora siamensis TaxID=555372 RepID=A0ABV6P3M7_9ACTN
MRRGLRLGVALLAMALAGSTTAAAAAPAGPGHFRPPADSLRALAAPTGLRFGTAVVPSDFDNPAYAKVVGEQFSVLTPGNEMKWQLVEPTRGTYDWSGGDRVVTFAQAHDQLVRGHTLMWHNQLPDWLTTGVSDGSISNDQLRALLHKHITDEVTHFRGKIWQWDVANEFFANSWDPHPLADGINGDDFWVSHLGEGILTDAFRWAHEADPHALLFYNDFNIGGEDGTNAKADAVYAWIKRMRAEGVPIDGVGSQGHVDTQYGYPRQLTDDLRRYASTGAKVAITEADVRTFVNNATEQVPTDHLAEFAQPYEFSNMLKACLAVPECLSFTAWGFTDAESWIPDVFPGEGYALLYDVHLNPKPVYTDLQDDLRLARHGAPHRR